MCPAVDFQASLLPCIENLSLVYLLSLSHHLTDVPSLVLEAQVLTCRPRVTTWTTRYRQRVFHSCLTFHFPAVYSFIYPVR